MKNGTVCSALTAQKKVQWPFWVCFSELFFLGHPAVDLTGFTVLIYKTALIWLALSLRFKCVDANDYAFATFKRCL